MLNWLTSTLKQKDRHIGGVVGLVTDEIRREHPQESLNQLAADAGLAPTTVYNLLDGTTRFPRATTVIKLCIASGIDFRLTPRGKVVFEHKLIPRLAKRTAKSA